jgi:hypothetical protein
VFSVAVATLVPVLITLCFAARPTVVDCDTAARAVALRGCTFTSVEVFAAVLRCETPRATETGVPGALALVRETRCAVGCEVADGRGVAPNAADAHAKTTNAKYNRFKRNPFYYSLYFIIKNGHKQVGMQIKITPSGFAIHPFLERRG